MAINDAAPIIMSHLLPESTPNNNFRLRSHLGMQAFFSTEFHGMPALQVECARRTKVIVAYDRGTDEYEVTLGKMRGLEFTVLGEVSGIHAGELARAVARLAGLDL